MGDEEGWYSTQALCLPFGQEENKTITCCMSPDCSQSPILINNFQDSPHGRSTGYLLHTKQAACTFELIPPPFMGISEKSCVCTDCLISTEEVRTLSVQIWTLSHGLTEGFMQSSSVDNALLAVPNHNVNLVNSSPLKTYRWTGVPSKVIWIVRKGCRWQCTAALYCW